MKRILVTVHGDVQGVGYRASCQREAQSLELTGWVRNRPDGTVEALIEGPDEKVDRLVAWCREGPRHADVSHVEVRPAPDGTPLKSFSVRLL